MLSSISEILVHVYPHFLLLLVLIKTFPPRQDRLKPLYIFICYAILLFLDWIILRLIPARLPVSAERAAGLICIFLYISAAAIFASLFLKGWILYKIMLITMWWFIYEAVRNLLFAFSAFIFHKTTELLLPILVLNCLILTLFSLLLICFRVNSSIRIPPAVGICICILCLSVEEITMATDEYTFLLLENGLLAKEICILCFLIALMIFVYYCVSTMLRQFENVTSQKYQLELQKTELDYARTTFEQSRKISHDIKNQLLLVSTMIRNEKYDEALIYLNDSVSGPNNLLRTPSSGNPTIDAVLYMEQIKAEKSGICLEINAALPRQLSISPVDISSVLFNLIDNAIEASAGIKNPYVNTVIKKDKNYILISVRNRTEIDILKNNPNLRTTKSDNTLHGEGLKIVRQIVDKNDGELDFSQEKDLFVVFVMLKENLAPDVGPGLQ